MTYVRESLAAPFTLFVNNSSGSDANSGSECAPFATAQKAVDTLCESYILGNQAVTIQLAATGIDYDGAALRRYVGSVDVDPATFTAPVIQGDPTNSGAVTIAPASGNGFTAVSVETPWCIANLTLAPPNGHGLQADWGSALYFRNVNFGACPNGSHLVATWKARIEALRGGYTITGGAQLHAMAVGQSVILAQSGGNTITIAGTPAFSAALVASQKQSIVDFSLATLSGAYSGAPSISDPDSLVSL